MFHWNLRINHNVTKQYSYQWSEHGNAWSQWDAGYTSFLSNANVLKGTGPPSGPPSAQSFPLAWPSLGEDIKDNTALCHGVVFASSLSHWPQGCLCTKEISPGFLQVSKGIFLHHLRNLGLTCVLKHVIPSRSFLSRLVSILISSGTSPVPRTNVGHRIGMLFGYFPSFCLLSHVCCAEVECPPV